MLAEGLSVHAAGNLDSGSIPPFDIDDDALVAKVATAMEVTRSCQEAQIARLSVILKVSLVALGANAFAWCSIAIWVRR